MPLSVFFLSFQISCQRHIVSIPDSPYPISHDTFSVDTIIDGFTIPYGLAILSDSEYYITDRIGKFFHFKNDNLIEIDGLPEVITFGTRGIPAIMHGGYMDISLHPNYKNNGWIYLSYLADDGLAKVDRFKILNNTATELETIFKTKNHNYYGNGMRIVWENNTCFFLNIGGSTYSTKKNPLLASQDLNDSSGKIHRINDDGSIPEDNPIFEGFTEPSTIYSYGHRDVQGLILDESNTLIGIEHGPKGGDELNIIKKGKNYGWPLFSYGVHYDGSEVSLISKDSAATFTELPIHYWTVQTRYGGVAIAPASLLNVENSNIDDWNNQYILGSLAFRRLMKYYPETNETVGLNIEGRVRTIKQLPSGDIIALIERNNTKLMNGKIIRISK